MLGWLIQPFRDLACLLGGHRYNPIREESTGIRKPHRRKYFRYRCTRCGFHTEWMPNAELEQFKKRSQIGW